MTQVHEILTDDGSGFSFLGDIAVKLRDLSLEQVTGVEASAPEFSTALIKIRIAGSRTDAAIQSHALVQRRYAERGYDLPPATPDPNLYTVAAYDKGQLVGTVGVRLDSTRGLAPDELYPGELAALRIRSLQLCEFTRLAVDDSAMSKTVLASLFHTAYLYAHRLCGVDAAVIEVNPRHGPFYIRALQSPSAWDDVAAKILCPSRRRRERHRQHGGDRGARRHLQGLFEKHGAPLFLKRDNGANLNEPQIQAVLAQYGVIPLNSPRACPRYNGAMENGLGYLKASLPRVLITPERWDLARTLPIIQLAIDRNNLLARPRLQGRSPLPVYQKEEPRRWTLRQRHEIFEWLKSHAEAMMHDMEKADQQSYQRAWRAAALTWLRWQGLITVSEPKSVTPFLGPP